MLNSFPMIIYRYFAKEVFLTLFAVTGILLLIFMSNQLIHYLHRAASGNISAALVLRLVAIQAPYLLGYLLPLGFYVALLLVYGRFQGDNEMIIWQACGFSNRHWLWLTQSFAVIVMLIVGGLTLWLSPRMMAVSDELRAHTQSELLVQTLMAERFQPLPDKKGVIYIEKLSPHRERTGRVFLAQLDAKEGWIIVSAKAAYETRNTATGESFIVLQEGQRYMGKPGSREFTESSFQRYGLQLKQGSNFFKHHHSSLTTQQLWRTASTDPHSMAELQWRFSIPFTVPILALLAIPLSRVNPRFGRYSQLLPALLIFIIYLNSLFIVRNGLEIGKLSPWQGLEWLHLLLLALGLYLLKKQNFFNKRLTRVTC